MAQSTLLQKRSVEFLVKIVGGHGPDPSHSVWQQSPIKGNCQAAATLVLASSLCFQWVKHTGCRLTYSPGSLLQLEHVIGKSKMILFGRILFSPNPQTILRNHQKIQKSMPAAVCLFVCHLRTVSGEHGLGREQCHSIELLFLDVKRNLHLPWKGLHGQGHKTFTQEVSSYQSFLPKC